MRMKIYMRRFVGYLFLSIFLALSFGPLSGNPFSKPIHYGANSTSNVYKEAMALNRENHNNTIDIFKGSWANSLRYSIATVFLLFGLFLMYKSYTKQPGIKLNPRWSTLAGDSICILFLVLGAYSALAYGIKRFTGTIPYLYEPIAMSMMAIAYLPIAAFLAFFASNQFGQSVEINRNRICIYISGKAQSILWEEIRGFGLKNTYTIAGGAKFLAPRKMQTKLTFKTSQGAISLVEPGLKKTKSKILCELKKNAPGRLQEEVAQLTKAW